MSQTDVLIKSNLINNSASCCMRSPMADLAVTRWDLTGQQIWDLIYHTSSWENIEYSAQWLGNSW
jgi:hypothetical protein